MTRRVGQGVFLPVPSNVSTRVTGSGDLPAGAYVYAVTTVSSDGGETTPSAIAPALLPKQGGARVSWDWVIGAASHRVYRGADLASLGLVAEVADEPTWLDDGTVVAGAAPPAVNSARGWASGAPVFSTVVGDWFRCRLQLPAAPETADPSGRRRTVVVPTLMYGLLDSAGQPVALSPETRLEVQSPYQFDGSLMYDVVSLPEPMRKKRRVLGWMVTLRRVEVGQAELVA